MEIVLQILKGTYTSPKMAVSILNQTTGMNYKVLLVCKCKIEKPLNQKIKFVPNLSLADRKLIAQQDYRKMPITILSQSGQYSGPSIIRTSIIRPSIIWDPELHMRIMICGMHVVAVDKKLLYTWLLNQLFCQLKIVRLLDKAVYHSAPLVARPVHSSWLFSPCSQQLALLALFTATSKHNMAHNFTYPDFSLILCVAFQLC